LTYGGFTDWVLPSCTSKAKNSSCYLYQFGLDACGGYSCMPSWDSAAQAYPYWSSAGYSSDRAYIVNFATGSVYDYGKRYSNCVRCVRGQ